MVANIEFSWWAKLFNNVARYNLKYVLSAFMLLIALLPCKCMSALHQLTSARNVISTIMVNTSFVNYNITVDEANTIIKAHQIGQFVPLTVMDLTQKMFIYEEKTECFLGTLEKVPKQFEANMSLGNVSDIIQACFPNINIFYAIKKLPQSRVKRFVPRLGNECENRTVWLLSRTKPKSFHATKENRGIRTKTFAGLQEEKKGDRRRRAVNNYFSNNDKTNSVQFYKKTNYQGNPYYKDDSSRKVKTAAKVPLSSNSFTTKKNTNSNPQTSQKLEENFVHKSQKEDDFRYLSNNANQWSRDTSLPVNQKATAESFPDKIVKDGQIFYRHDVGKQEEEGYLEHQSDGPFNALHNQIITKEDMPSETMPRGFEFLMDHVRHIGAQRPIISAAIAGASIRGSSKGSTSHVIGSAINGGYFAASAKGYDNKGGSIHSHVQGTGKGVSGGASVIAPDRDGEAFIQLDNSERGLSIGHSSTHNGEAFVIADADSESEFHLQHGDSTSSFVDKYEKNKFGHTFGEAKSSISPSSKKTQENNYKINKKNSGSNEKKTSETKAVGMGLIEDIMEKVHQPDISPSMAQNNEGYYKDYPILDNVHHPEILYKQDKPQKIGSNPNTSTLDLIGTPSPKDKGTVGMVTYPFGQVGSPPGPGELLTQAPDTYLSFSENSEDNYFDESHYNSNLNNDDYYFNGEEPNILGNNQHDIEREGSYPVQHIGGKIYDRKNHFDNKTPEYSYLGSLVPKSKINRIDQTKTNINRLETTLNIENPLNKVHKSYDTSVSADNNHIQVNRNTLDNIDNAMHGQPSSTYSPSNIQKSLSSFSTDSIVYQPYSSILHLSDPTGDESFFNTPYYAKNSKNAQDYFRSNITNEEYPKAIKPIINQNHQEFFHNQNYAPHMQKSFNPNRNVLTSKQRPHYIDSYSPELVSGITSTYDDELFTTYSNYNGNDKPDINYHTTPSYSSVSKTQNPETVATFEEHTEFNVGTKNIILGTNSESTQSNENNGYSTVLSLSSSTNTNTVANPNNSPPLLETKPKILYPGIIGSTRQIVPVEPGGPHLQVVTMDINDKRKQLYQREGTPVGPGEKIPGASGYRVPPGFRGRVVYGHALPIEVESRKAVKGYNTRVKVSPQNPYQGPVFASVSGPEAASKFIQSPSSGVHITLNAPSRRESSPIPRESRISSTHNTGNKALSNYQDRTTSRQNYQRTSNQQRQPNQFSQSEFKNSNGQCGYYKNECHKMFGPFQTQTLCVPTFIIVSCCC